MIRGCTLLVPRSSFITLLSIYLSISPLILELTLHLLLSPLDYIIRVSRIEEKLQLARDQLGIYRTTAYIDRVKRLEADLEKEMIRIDTTMTPNSGTPPHTLHMHLYPYISPLALSPRSQ